ncbi:hypothetical protein GEV33_007549 [Tenebrio molitor]|uniref:Uncharacterized protein n=1 Tax=Tenebrio molitor TaxID=7067 RepID=A0A8J6LC32_TENMO|nr:hypothetical protein GEV33_007549 [Tenebrio molitor]
MRVSVPSRVDSCSTFRVRALRRSYLEQPLSWAPRWSASCNNPVLCSAQVGWYLVMMRLGCLGRVEPRVIVRPACPPGELLGQSYPNVRVDVPYGAFRSEQKNSLGSSA